MHTTCHLCRGKDCRKAKGFAKLTARLRKSPTEVHEVTCQGICKGPVVGLDAGDGIRWYRKVRGKTRRRALLQVLRGMPVPDDLVPLEDRKRRGRLKGKASPLM